MIFNKEFEISKKEFTIDKTSSDIPTFVVNTLVYFDSRKDARDWINTIFKYKEDSKKHAKLKAKLQTQKYLKKLVSLEKRVEKL